MNALLSLEQTAERLTSVTKARVSIEDVLQLILDKRLPLSVKFLKPVKVCPGKIVHYTQQEIDALTAAHNYIDDLNWVDDVFVVIVPVKDGRPLPSPRPKIVCSHYLGDDRWMTFREAVTTITGVWDLPMVGGEAFDVVSLFHALTGNPIIAPDHCDGTFVIRNGVMACKLLTLEDPIKDSPPGQSHALNDYAAASSLPDASVLGVRPEALKALEASLRKQPLTPASDELTTRSKRTMQTVIAALCNKMGIDWKAPGAARKIEALTDLLDAKVSEQTIKQTILEGMDDAIESRSTEK
ncbi:hypothetical protein [Pseudoduganella violaceinigra]|uniref:hypothetical protein n=1 Tax=Pseudoduganella violaceinigra TaxID=246602 RepID=UPI000488DA6C|nr:hypothetical protein [Pseudoduganella violaceinigra]